MKKQVSEKTFIIEVWTVISAYTSGAKNMNWRQIYSERLKTAVKAAELVRSGDAFWTPLCLGQPSAVLMDAIADRNDELEDVEYAFGFAIKPYKIFQPEYRRTFNLMPVFYSTMPHQQELARSMWANFFPIQSSDFKVKVPHRRRTYPRRIGLITQVSSPDEHGYVNLGLDAFWTKTAIEEAEYVIAEVNEKMPRAFGDMNIHVSEFSAFVENSSDLPVFSIPEATDVERKIAENVVGLLKDRDCLQLGIGAVPAMIGKLLVGSGLKDLGVHTEMAPAGVHDLVEKDIVTCRYKKLHPGKILLSFAVGDSKLYRFLGNNPMCEWRETFYVNNPSIICQEDNIVAVNGTLEVDLTGQVCSESYGNIMRSGPGGQLDFVIGAFWSKGGRAINLVPATAKGGAVSRIVPYLSQGARVTVPRHYTGYVVTEYGVADLYGRTEPERAEALISVAHPDFRDELEKGARERGLLYKKIF